MKKENREIHREMVKRCYAHAEEIAKEKELNDIYSGPSKHMVSREKIEKYKKFIDGETVVYFQGEEIKVKDYVILEAVGFPGNYVDAVVFADGKAVPKEYTDGTKVFKIIADSSKRYYGYRRVYTQDDRLKEEIVGRVDADDIVILKLNKMTNKLWTKEEEAYEELVLGLRYLDFNTCQYAEMFDILSKRMKKDEEKKRVNSLFNNFSIVDPQKISDEVGENPEIKKMLRDTFDEQKKAYEEIA